MLGVAHVLGFVLGWLAIDRWRPASADSRRCPRDRSGAPSSITSSIASSRFPANAAACPSGCFITISCTCCAATTPSPAGECEIAGFYAGLGEGESFTFVVIALATFALGLAVSPAVVTPAKGAFDPARVLAAYLRGRRVRIDIMGPWDYWARMPLPIGVARDELGIA